MMIRRDLLTLIFFFFNDTATTEIYTLSLHDALPILCFDGMAMTGMPYEPPLWLHSPPDRKSTRLNSSHHDISYAVFCLNKNKQLLRLYNALSTGEATSCGWVVTGSA